MEEIFRIPQLRISINEIARQKLLNYVKIIGEEEIGGLLETELVKGGILVKDVILLKQTVNFSHVDVDLASITEYSKDLFVKNPKKLAKIRGWWHKHGLDGWSMIDDTTFNELLDFFGKWVIGVVYVDTKGQHHKKRLLWRLEVKGRYGSFSFNTYSAKIIKQNFNRAELMKQCRKNVKELVTVTQFQQLNQHNKHRMNKGDWDWMFNLNDNTNQYHPQYNLYYQKMTEEDIQMQAMEDELMDLEMERQKKNLKENKGNLGYMFE